MFPWLWLWAPTVHFPWSGAVSQDIAPRTDWFSAHIPAQAGDAALEARITATASYGHQIDKLMDAVLALADALPADAATAHDPALVALRTLRERVEAVKAESREEAADRLVNELQELRQRGGPAYAALVGRLQPLLVPSPTP